MSFYHLSCSNVSPIPPPFPSLLPYSGISALSLSSPSPLGCGLLSDACCLSGPCHIFSADPQPLLAAAVWEGGGRERQHRLQGTRGGGGGEIRQGSTIDLITELKLAPLPSCADNTQKVVITIHNRRFCMALMWTS